MKHNKTTIDMIYNGSNISINRIQEESQGNKTAIILHGMALYGDYYFDAIEYLPDDYSNYYFIDMLNHGNSDGRKGFLPSKNTVTEILDHAFNQIMMMEGMSKIDMVVGESMGGIFALYYTLKYSPNKFNNAVIFSAPLKIQYTNFIDPKYINILYYYLFARDRLVVPIKEMNRKLVKDASLLERIYNDTLVPQHININYLLTLKGMIKYILSHYSKLDLNLLLIYGANDAISNTNKICNIFNQLNNAEVVILKEKPHAIFWDKTNDYKNMIKRWLSGQ